MYQLSRFLSAMSEMGIIKVEETGKGVESITSVDHKHPLIKKFSPILLDISSHTMTPAEKSTNTVRIVCNIAFDTKS